MTQLTLTTDYVLGDTIYATNTDELGKLAGNTTATKNFLTQTGTGSVSAAPAWGTIAAADYPVMVGDSGSGGTQGAVPAPSAGDAAAGKFLKANGTWAVPSGSGNLTVLSSNTTYTVKSSGGDYTSVNAALQGIKNIWVPAGITLTISIDPGVFTEPAAITEEVFNNPCGGNIVITGSTPLSKTLNSVQSSSGSSGAYSVILNLADVTDISTGNYAFITSVSGGSNSNTLLGCWKITNVDSGNSPGPSHSNVMKQ